ncbi:hypothetical protein B0H63DRAFT_241877 [Podospora didyma]|uniref:CASTOR ACT domain-containing protein n=1 Tax=Podospora didyma TaxID=330526 RepID=A0AAE0KKN3_9PEZI|nr:hypothetical protein B0H63DRAFT_241877 [Podospora didyma]
MAMSATISFLEGTLSLVHIPLNLYSDFLQPILKVLLPHSQGLDPNSGELGFEGLALDNQHGFLNISVTPLECSIVCHSAWAKSIFEPAIKRLPKEFAKAVSISKDAYAVVSVTDAGMDAGSRVVDLASPLALAGIPIFFITTYYSDFILVPNKDRSSVVKALLARGFFFNEDESSYKSGFPPSHSRGASQSSDPPSTPPPSSIGELQTRTFELLKKRNVVPYIEPDLRLTHCSGRESTTLMGYSERPSLARRHTANGTRQSWINTIDTKLYTSIVSALVSQPKFLSITLAKGDSPSLLLDHSLLKLFGDSLIGPPEGTLVPIFLDLNNLPFEATGIVSGVAGKLVQEMQSLESAELSYLSTARAGAVILAEELSVTALGILRPLLTKEEP